ncbi:MAG: hypothetical protein ACXAEX_23595, partial [Promethearchaeota archaeon]
MPTDTSKSICVVRWLANIPNLMTQRIYLYSLNKFVDFLNRDPEEIIELGRINPEEAHNLLKIFYNNLPLASTTKMTIYQALRSFFRTNRVIIGRKPRTFRSVVEYEPRRLYTQEEVAWLVDTANNPRNKALITFLAQSGQRVSVVVSLRIRHIELNQSSPIVIDVPAILKNKRGFNVNKAQTAYKFA